MATDKEVKAALQQLLDYYAPKDMPAKRLAIYAAQLQRLDGGVLKDAVAKCLTTNTWFPKLNELFAIANELPVQAKVSNQLRAQALALEHKYWHDRVFIAEEWQRVADMHHRLGLVHGEQRILDRMERYAEAIQ